MKNRRFFGWLGCLVVLVISAVAVGGAEMQGYKPDEGLQMYYPNRIDWFIVWMSVHFHDPVIGGSWHPSVHFDRAARDNNALKVTIYYFPNTPPKVVQLVRKSIRDYMETEKSRLGWKWLKLEENVQLIAPSRDAP
jgi:hypothetical protein